MKFYYNDLFAQITKNPESLKNSKLPPSLSKVINAGIKKADECYYLKGLNKKFVYSPDLNDESGNEAFVNKIHLDDFVLNSNIKLLRTGITFIYALIDKLKREQENFRFILSFDKQYCSVTFYKIRPDQHYVDVKKVNEFIHEAVLIADTY